MVHRAPETYNIIIIAGPRRQYSMFGIRYSVILRVVWWMLVDRVASLSCLCCGQEDKRD